VQKLLHDTGASFTERVLEQRLQQARRMLADRRNDRLKVSEIAMTCGFNEVSYFNRSSAAASGIRRSATAATRATGRNKPHFHRFPPGAPEEPGRRVGAAIQLPIT